MRQKGYVTLPLIVVVILLGAVVYFVYQNFRTTAVIEQLKREVGKLSVTSTPIAIDNPTEKPTTKPASKFTISSTSTPTPTSSPKPFVEEEKMMRKTLAGFEMYIGARNTAGALTFFTPPQSSSAKARYEEIKNKNLPYGLKSWSFVMDQNSLLIADEINNGYKVHVVECRTNMSSCPTLTIELVRNSDAENGFMVDRYYGSEYTYQSNLGEEIKYKGFAF